MNDVLMTGLQLVTEVLAQDEPRQTGPDFGKASPFGLTIVVLLLIGTFVLVWSMNRHLRRLPKSFDTDTDTDEDTGKGAAPGDTGAGNSRGADPDLSTGSPADGVQRDPD
ncbi:hypothetical protein [Mycobacterium sp. SMC-4]|uniref:hypothetical protein n=1 Tax=Mycobacterium sp. SMC-4 TaxID=2857059 RepID=UPI0021B3FCB8|nr:hypothetical protein [Mycobacterium sp. SMC-4]UXA16940.1 hypothetical protein KXD98_19580 [Mycobacterium sp. SMC-4]